MKRGCRMCGRRLAIDVTDADWPVDQVDAIFNANTVHIVAWPAVQRMFAGIGRVLAPGGLVVPVRAVQLWRQIHIREQCALRCLVEESRSRQRRARF
jgi:hypothetical protein